VLLSKFHFHGDERQPRIVLGPTTIRPQTTSCSRGTRCRVAQRSSRREPESALRCYRRTRRSIRIAPAGMAAMHRKRHPPLLQVPLRDDRGDLAL
jgi:hypothetical protein